MIYTALLLGFFGSFHCIGMCGPVAFSLPSPSSNWFKSRLFYNLGRIQTYLLLGLMVGLAGKTFALSLSQQALSVVSGGLIFLFFISWVFGIHFFTWNRSLQKLSSWVKQQMSFYLKKRTLFSFFLIGMANGLLPCGLVYLALAGALATGHIIEGAFYMSLFGLGTFPAMLATSLAGNLLQRSFRTLIYKKMLPLLTLTFALLLILRGLNLGIPYLSPHIHTSTIEKACCHQP